MALSPYLPPHPVTRMIELCRAIGSHKRWFHNWSMLRYAASGLLFVEGPAEELATRLFDAADQLKEGAGWFSNLRTDVRFCLVAGLLRHETPVDQFKSMFARTRAAFREAGLPKGETEEAMATLICLDVCDHAPTEAEARRIAEVFAGMRAEHRLLTGREDYPAATLLALRGEPVPEIIARVELLYDALHELHFHRGNQLQLASHLLYFVEAPDAVALARFRALYDAFQAEGLWMNSGDYDEVAILAFLDLPAPAIVERVLADRLRLREELHPRPSKQEGFTLATQTAFLHFAADGETDLATLGSAQRAAVLALLAAQQAAVSAAASAAAASAAAS